MIYLTRYTMSEASRTATTCLLTLAAVHCSGDIALGQEWTVQYGSSGYDNANALVADGMGGVYVCGQTEGDLGGTNAGESDAYVARYDSDGNQLWIIQFGSDEADYAAAISLDGAGGFYVGGTTRGDLGGSTGASHKPFLAHFDGKRNLQWIKQPWSGILSGEGLSLAPDGGGGVYFAGWAWAIGSVSTFSKDGFIIHSGPDGNISWVRLINSGTLVVPFEDDAVFALAPDGRGGVFAGGTISHNSMSPRVRSSNAFVAHFDDAGNEYWRREFGAAGGAKVVALSADQSGSVYFAGETRGALGASSFGGFDAFVGRFNHAGHNVWLEQFGTEESDRALGVASDNHNRVYVFGNTRGEMSGSRIGDDDVFLSVFSRSGKLRTITQFGTDKLDIARAIAADDKGNLFTSGFTYGSFGIAPLGGSDAYIVKFGHTGEVADSCYADCDQSTGPSVLDIFDFLCFQDAFVAGCP